MTIFCSELKVCTPKHIIFPAQGKLVTNWWDNSWIKVRQRWVKIRQSTVVDIKSGISLRRRRENWRHPVLKVLLRLLLTRIYSGSSFRFAHVVYFHFPSRVCFVYGVKFVTNILNACNACCIRFTSVYARSSAEYIPCMHSAFFQHDPDRLQRPRT